MAFFLLETGLLVGRQMSAGRAKIDKELFAFLSPPIKAAISLCAAYAIDLHIGDAVLLVVLSSSTSYIVMPAVARYAIPEARPGVYFTMALGLTFPFNILVGFPAYYAFAQCLWP